MKRLFALPDAQEAVPPTAPAAIAAANLDEMDSDTWTLTAKAAEADESCVYVGCEQDEVRDLRARGQHWDIFWRGF